MDLSIYVGKKVKIDLVNGFFYEGIVTDVSDDSISLKDRNNNFVTLSEKSILFIREVNENA